MKNNYDLSTLENLTEEVRRRNSDNSPLLVWSVTNDKGLIKSEEFFKKRVYSQNLKNYKIIRPNEIAYNPSRINVGSIATNVFNEPGLLSPLYVVLKCKKELDPEYLLYFLRSNEGKNRIRHLTQGSVRNNLNYKNFKKIEILIPPLPIQQKIVSILKRVVKLIGIRKDGNKLVKDFLNSFFLEMFGNPVKNPKGWNFATPKDISADIKNAITIGPFGSNLMVKDFRENGVPLIFVKNIRANRFSGQGTKFIDSAKAKELDSCKIISGDVLMTKMGDPPGDVALYPENSPLAIITADCIKLTLNPKKALNHFVLWVFRTKFVQDQILRQTRGVAQKKINLTIFKSIKFPLPDLNSQLYFVEIVEFIEKIETYQKQSEKEIEDLYNLLSQKAFKGELAC